MTVPRLLSVYFLVVVACGACKSSAVSSGDGGCESLEPPPIVLQSGGGEQRGAQGSYCTSCEYLSSSTCLDGNIAPVQFTVVHPGDEITFSLPGGVLVAGQRCNPACPPTLRIDTVCGRPATIERALAEDQSWTVDLQPGAYNVWLDSHFDADNGLSGGIYVGFGLIVDDARERTLMDVERAEEACDHGPDAG